MKNMQHKRNVSTVAVLARRLQTVNFLLVSLPPLPSEAGIRCRVASQYCITPLIKVYSNTIKPVEMIACWKGLLDGEMGYLWSSTTRWLYKLRDNLAKNDFILTVIYLRL